MTNPTDPLFWAQRGAATKPKYVTRRFAADERNRVAPP